MILTENVDLNISLLLCNIDLHVNLHARQKRSDIFENAVKFDNYSVRNERAC